MKITVSTSGAAELSKLSDTELKKKFDKQLKKGVTLDQIKGAIAKPSKGRKDHLEAANKAKK